MNIPLILTFTRLIVSPIPAVLLVFLLPSASIGMQVFLSVLFVFVALTDFFDGYLARLWRQETALGKVFDPIADKMLVVSAIIVLVYLHKVFWLWAIIIIGREIFITGLRELALENNFSLPVTLWGKYKSAAQYAYVAFVIIAPACNNISVLLGGITSFVTLISGYMYVRNFMHYYKHR